MDRMFIGMILTLAINDQGRMLIGQFLNLMTLLRWRSYNAQTSVRLIKLIHGFE